MGYNQSISRAAFRVVQVPRVQEILFWLAVRVPEILSLSFSLLVLRWVYPQHLFFSHIMTS